MNIIYLFTKDTQERQDEISKMERQASVFSHLSIKKSPQDQNLWARWQPDKRCVLLSDYDLRLLSKMAERVRQRAEMAIRARADVAEKVASPVLGIEGCWGVGFGVGVGVGVGCWFCCQTAVKVWLLSTVY